MLAALENQESFERATSEEGREMVQRLNHSFAAFIGVAEDLKEAYERLRERAEAMDLKLKKANARLSRKVLELDGMTRRLNDLLQNLPSAVVAEDGGGRITHFNRAAEKLFKIPSKEAVGRTLGEIEPLKDALLLAGGREGNLDCGSGRERAVQARDGRRLIVASRIAELEDAKGVPAGRIEILTDLTETERLRREVHRLDTLAALGEMAASVAHQIRNPLNGVEGFASLLQRSLERDAASHPDALRYSRNIVQGVREVNAIISGMLMLTRSEPLKLETVSLDRLAEEAAEAVRQAAELSKRPVEVRVRTCPGGVRIQGDGIKLKQAFLNIAHNALEAFAPDRPGRLRISTRRSPDRAEIRIADAGKGMSPDVAAKVFQPFFTTRESGIGLGLSVASKVVDLHGGRLRLRSLPGVGTVFKITLLGPEPAGKDGA